MTVPCPHEPPVIVKIPIPVTGVIVGAVVNVSAPAFAPVALLVTVMVPFFMFRRGPLVRSGPLNDAVPPCTVKVTLLVTPLFPFGVLTLMFWPPNVVPGARLRVAVTLVALTAAKLVTVMSEEPGAVTPVAPPRLVPARVTLMLVPRVPEAGEMEVSVGLCIALCIVNVTGLLLVPPDEVTLTVLIVGAALAVIVKFAVIVVEFTAVKLGTVTPPPDTVTAVAPIRLVPVRVTATVVPRTPELGLIDVNVGIGLLPWNSTAPTSKRFGCEGSGLLLPK